MGSPPEPSTRDSGSRAELVAVMREQGRICEELLKVVTAERVAVLAGRIDDLDGLTLEKGRLIDGMERLEATRRGLAEQVAREVGLPHDVPLAGLAARLGAGEAEELLQVRQQVADVVSKLRESNEGNLMLMRKSLELVRDSIRQLRRAVGSGDTYTSDGHSSFHGKSNLMVDCRA